MKGDTLGSIISGFLGGVLVRSLSGVPLPIISLISLVGAALLLVLFIGRSKQRSFFLFALVVFFVGLGMMRFHFADTPLVELPLSSFQHSHVDLKGMIDADPDMRQSSTVLTVNVAAVNETPLKKPELLLVRTDPYTSYEYGEVVRLSGTVELPENFSNDLGKEFDYISYLKKDGISFQMKDPEIQKTGKNEGNIIFRKLYELKRGILGRISSYISEPESGLMAGILLGTKQSLGESWRNKFIATGTIHIIALSGYNVTIVAEWMMKAFGLVFARALSVWFGVSGIVLFAIMTGAGSTVVRASIMAILVLVARMTGRTYDIGRALFIAGFAMVALNPWILVFDVSFQLSFLATIGLVYLSPKVMNWFPWMTKKWGIKEVVSATLATNIFVLPFILSKMGIVSVISLPVNLLILPLIPLTMILGIVLVLVSLALPFGGVVLGAMSYGLLHLELSIISFFSELPFASVSVSHVPLLLTLAAYGLLSWYVFSTPKTLTK